MNEYELYLKLAQQHHELPNTWNGSNLRDHHMDAVNQLIEQHGITSILDYGCGKALHHPPEWRATLYDPAVPQYSEEPTGEYDLVICTDVLEHIPESGLQWVIDRLHQFSKGGWLYVSVCCRKAKQLLTMPNSMRRYNAHVCIKPEAWWKKRVQGERVILKFTD